MSGAAPPKKIVYFDPKYPTGWINRVWSQYIATFFQNNGFTILDASQLQTWMEGIINQKKCYESVVIFSQDIVPSTIFGDFVPNVLLRHYLDEGGRIIWIGDIPIWYKGDNQLQLSELWPSGAHYAVLGVQPLMSESSSISKWIGKWENLLSIQWYSQRPIAFEYSGSFKETRNIGLVIYPMAYADVTLSPVSWNTLVITRWKKAGARVIGFGINIPFNLGVKTELTEKYPEELSIRPQKLVTSWHVVYSSDFPYQGFYRLWDTGSTEPIPPNELLLNMLSIATHNLP